MNFLDANKPRLSHFEWEHLIPTLKCTLEKLSYWAHSNCTTLLHLAIIQNDLSLISILLDTGFDVNVKNLFGDTALLFAAKSVKYNAVKILLNAGADICVTDAFTKKTDLENLMTEMRSSANSRRVIGDIMPYIMNNLKRRKLNTERLVELLHKVNCPLKYVWTINDAQVTRQFLESNPIRRNYLSEMQLAIERRDVINVELLMRYSSKSGRSNFYLHLYGLFIVNHMESWRVFIRHLSNWNVIGQEAIDSFSAMFASANKNQLKVLLDSNIALQLRKFGVDVRTGVFGNANVDAVELLQYQNFNVNACSIKRRTDLHIAVKNNLVKNVRFLLDSGANVDSKDKRGRSALFDSIRWNGIENGQLLLKHGADVQVVDINGLTVFELAENKNPTLLEFLIARLSISYIQGIPIKEVIQDQIDFNEDLKEIFETCCQQLRILKTFEVVKPITLFSVLTDNIESICRYVCNQNTIALLNQYKNVHELHLLYYSTIKSKIIKISNWYHFKYDMAEIISKNTGKSVDFDHLVIRNISKYLTQKHVDDFVKYVRIV